MICLFSSSLAYSILASVFSAPTANKVRGLYPFSPEWETCCMLSFCRAFEFLPLYKRTFRFTPAILEDCTVPRIRSGFLPTCEALQDFTPTRKWRRHFCRQRTKFAAFILSLQRGKRAAGFPFAKLLHTCLFTRGHSTSPQFTTASKSDRKNSCRFFVV